MSDRNYFSAKLYQTDTLMPADTNYANSFSHPVIDYHYIANQPILGGELSFTGSARSLSRTDSTDSNHAVAAVNWRSKMIDPIGEVWAPFANVRGDAYSYSNAVDPVTLKPIADATVVRGMAAAGLTYSYPFVANTEFASHVIEPTAQIIARPNNVAQRLLPNEDAKSLIFDDTLLFDTDKFSGYDRFETGTRANVGVQYTLQGKNGFYTRAVLGQSLQLAGDNPFVDPGLDPTGKPNFSPVNGLETDHSDYVAGAYIAPFKGVNLMSQARFDQNSWSLRREDSLINATYGPLLASAAYSYTHFDPIDGTVTNEQDVLGSLGLKLTNNWSVLGTMRYNIEVNQRIQDALQLKYADECFVLTATYTETFIDNALLNLVPDRTIMLRFELKHIGEFNYNTSAVSHVFGEENMGPKL
jgi:LPS-assembly protein